MLKAGLVNPFVQSAYTFLQDEINMEVTRGQLRLESSKSTSGEVNVAVGVAGDAEGIVLYSMSGKTAKAIAAALLNEAVRSSNCRVVHRRNGNTYGSSGAGLEEHGTSANSLPTIIGGKGVIYQLSIYSAWSSQ